MQIDRCWRGTGSQELPDLVHMRAGLVLRWKLLQRDQRRRQCFRDNPFVVTGYSLFWHWPSLTVAEGLREHCEPSALCLKSSDSSVPRFVSNELSERHLDTAAAGLQQLFS